MQKATCTYVAPFGESKVVEWDGVTFFDGKPVEINSVEHPHMINKIGNNPHFDVQMGKEDNQPMPAAKKRGRPSAAMVAEAKALAEKTEADVKTATAKAKEAKADSEAMTKAASEKPEAGPTPAAPRTDLKAGMAAATAHDFEKDRQDEIARRDALTRPAIPPVA